MQCEVKSIRFVRGVLLGDDDKLYLEFIDVQKDKNKVVKRRIGLAGEQTVEEPFK